MIPLFRCDEIYREFTGSDLKKKNSNNERRVVVLTSLDRAGLHKLWYPGIRDSSTWSKFGAHGEHGDVFLFSNLGAL